ncbi:MAG: 4-hydroxybenzoyl-CoA reductase subunit gamma [Rhodospirillaceae bacterium]|nr:4-hydroxybenzoyl-CoA reductase subunit gamma [Rhodospirillaceae bacterium]
MSRRDISLTVNGKALSGAAEPRMTLLDFLRDVLGLSGTHMGCEHGVCGACTVIHEGQPVRSCLMLAVQAERQSIETIEGLAGEDGSLSVLQDAFRDAHGLQCGYCTPGMLMSAEALLRENTSPTDENIREAIGGNICRCTGYTQIIDSIRLAAERLRETSS